MVKKIVKYVANDGKEFNSEVEAERHEKVQANRKSELYEKFINTYSGQKLLKNHNINEYGIWEVRGEDPNCDLGGHHHNPYLFTAEGYLDNIIEKAVDHKGFWTWGGGGDIKKVIIEKV